MTNLFSTLGTKRSQNNAKHFAGTMRYLENKKAENLILAEEAEMTRKSAIANMASMSGKSRTRTRALVASEQAKFKVDLTKHLFAEALHGIFMEALVLDDDFKIAYEGNLFNLVEGTVTQLFESGQLTFDRIKNKTSYAMREVLLACESAAEKQTKLEFSELLEETSKAKEILNEKNKEKQSYHKLDPVVKGEFEDDKRSESKRVAEAVKDKVVKVVREEQETAAKEQAEQEEIKAKNEELKQQVESGEKDYDDAKSESVKIIPKKKLQEHSLFRSLQTSIALKSIKEAKENLQEGQQLEMKLEGDRILAETIAHYTLMECLHTARLVDYTPSELRSLAKELAFVK